MKFSRTTTDTDTEETPTVSEENAALSESVITEILMIHEAKVPDSTRYTMPGAPRFRAPFPPVPLAYSPETGAFVGTPIDPKVAEHSWRFVVINDDVLPTAEEIRRRVRIAPDGTVRWLP